MPYPPGGPEAIMRRHKTHPGISLSRVVLRGSTHKDDRKFPMSTADNPSKQVSYTDAALILPAAAAVAKFGCDHQLKALVEITRIEAVALRYSQPYPDRLHNAEDFHTIG
ncbi:hypothetical protein PoB_005925000 [Plakobranchus ocellatus]|uniref:Uncharacterized protein n=1 Tax=Plakobranchus ocellatus TaxID=259542 RepID=A0AAV4CLU2_9GAST|nr:hypothetical protein PoB_005925000 [Plakobranchus ocellatus]